MKNLATYIGVLGCFLSLAASANESPFQLSCEVSTRVIVGSLVAEVNPSKKFLGYEFTKYHASNPSQNYHLKGSNQQGFGYSGLSTSSVSVTEEASGKVKIVAEGIYFDRVTPVGKDEIQIVLEEKSYQGLGTHSLESFVVNGVAHKLDGPNHCALWAIDL